MRAGYDLLLWTSRQLSLPSPVTPCRVRESLYTHQGVWCRPLRVLAEDCRVMVDVEARNAVIAMVMHLMSAFKTPARPRAPQVLALACVQEPPPRSVHE